MRRFRELDALGASRAQFNAAEMKSLVNQLLTEMDGVNSDNSHILVIGATNTPWQIDSALLRPGRFDKMVFVPPPDQEGRIEIFKLALSDKPKEIIDLKKLARLTDGFSGADIKQAVDEALEEILPQAIEQDRVIPLTTKSIELAIAKTRCTTKEWFNTVKSYIDYANQTGIYNDVEMYMKKHEII